MCVCDMVALLLKFGSCFFESCELKIIIFHCSVCCVCVCRCEQAEGNVNALDNKDYSPLHWACYNGQLCVWTQTALT